MKHARTLHIAPFWPKLTVFIMVSILWLALDRITKIWADAATPGTVLVGDIAHLFEFRLVHNTGAAWGMFSNSTTGLGVFSVLVCLALVVVLCTYVRKEGTMLQAVCLALVFAGGLGNAIDRFCFGYVVDFIHTLFMSFPVFNIADIGVTCGIILFSASLFFDGRRAREKTLG